MNIEVFEKQILNRRLTPVHLFCGRGSRVRWFVCLDTRPQPQYSIIVYDAAGLSWVLDKKIEDIPSDADFNILQKEDGVTVNGIPMRRLPDLDLTIGA